ncbi:hypothetical protein ACFIQG_03375, partial [Comamonas odontotermitis]|uniref:hypothetical protein n=1 Tax=Comamonas odontotermitis TaxID=379895 RepID=UPI0036723C05
MAMSDERPITPHSPRVGTLAGAAGVGGIGGVGLSTTGPDAAVHSRPCKIQSLKSEQPRNTDFSSGELST